MARAELKKPTGWRRKPVPPLPVVDESDAERASTLVLCVVCGGAKTYAMLPPVWSPPLSGSAFYTRYSRRLDY